jgi:hypothetical protein
VSQSELKRAIEMKLCAAFQADGGVSKEPQLAEKGLELLETDGRVPEVSLEGWLVERLLFVIVDVCSLGCSRFAT